MIEPDRAGRLAITLTWLHAISFAVVAAACYVAPELWFGDAAWLPLARLAVLLLAAALSAFAIVSMGVAASGNAREVGLVLLASLLFDAQVPILLLSLPASIEYWDRALGIPWWVVPQLFLVAVGTTLFAALRLRRTLKERS